ncbi:MAG: hypothetical protein LAO20_05585 [Acidobacteriia bacterium]|nr:hypothetical protein [Terriglobia bacterium]
MATPNPITAGPRAVLHDPVVFLLELLWRWCFGGVAFAVLFASALALSNGVTVTAADSVGLRSHDALQVTLALRHTLAIMPARLLITALAVLLFVTLLWTLLGAAGRALLLSRTAPDKRPFRFRSILVVQGWRAAFAWLAILAMITLIAVAAGIAGSKKDPDPFFFYLVGMVSSLFIAVFWAAINWYLSLATIFCYAGTRARGAVRETIGWVHVRAADLGGISGIFVLVRLAFVALTVILLFLPSGILAASPRASFLWMSVVALLYFGFSDFLNIARLLSYMSVEDAVAEEIIEASGRHPGESKRRPPRF